MDRRRNKNRDYPKVEGVVKMIRRYLSTETVFNHNKYMLSPIKAEVVEEANGMFESEIEIMRHVALNKGDIISAPTPRGEQPFRVYRIVKTLAGKKVFSKHIFYDLMKNFLIDVRPSLKSCNEAIQYLLANTETPTDFTGSSDVVGSNTAYYIRKNPVEAIMGTENSLLNLWGGNLVRDGKNIQIKANGNDRGFEIRLGKNLMGIEDDSDESGITTRLYPTIELDQVVYALPEKYVNSPQIGNYPEPVIKEVRVALTEEEKILPIEDIYIVMRNYCNNLFNVDNIDKPIVNYKIDFVQLKNISGYEKYKLLEQLDLYDLVKINVENLGINLKAKVISYRYDCLKEKYSQIELGGFKSSAKYQTANIIKQIQSDLVNQKGLIAGAIDYATNVITGNKGGYVVTRNHPDGKPYEILIMDTDDINTAIEVTRFNKEGIGWSHSGYNGPFETSIINGQIVTGTGFFNSIVTNLIASDIGSSLNLTSNTAITGLVADKASNTDLTLTADALTLKLGSSGSKNLILNSGFQDGLNGWIVTQNTTALVRTSAQYPDMPSGNALLIPMEIGKTNTAKQVISNGFDRNRKKWVLSGFIRNTATVAGTTNPYASIQITAKYTDATVNYFTATPWTEKNYLWKKFEFPFTTNADKQIESIEALAIGRDMTGLLMFSSLVLSEGEVFQSWSNADNEAYATSYKFTPTAFELKDINGSVIIETSKGIANEQNQSSVQNVEDGYPLNMSFRIGDTTSVIKKVELRLKQYNFRTDSKGAASGGGSTSGPSSKSTTDQRWNGSVLTFEASGAYVAAVPGVHQHAIDQGQFAHDHGMAHTHTTPAHSHSVIFGILEIENTNGTIEVDINGVRRTGTTNTDTILDITTWVTTNGIHNLSLRSPNMKRIQCDLFIKSYIRR